MLSLGCVKIAKLLLVLMPDSGRRTLKLPRLRLAGLTSHASAHGRILDPKAESFIPGTAQ